MVGNIRFGWSVALALHEPVHHYSKDAGLLDALAGLVDPLVQRRRQDRQQISRFATFLCFCVHFAQDSVIGGGHANEEWPLRRNHGAGGVYIFDGQILSSGLLSPGILVGPSPE